MSDPVRLERDGAVARLLLDRPLRRNALDLAMWQRLALLAREAARDDAVRVIILASARPGMFSAGADIDDVAAHAADPDWRAQFQQAVRDTQYALALSPRPVIAAIGGDAVGGGCGLALACDIRIASAGVRFGVTPARLGLVYSLFDTRLLVDAVGAAWARRILFSADLIDAATALRIGLVDEIADDPLAAAHDLAHRIAARSQHSVREAKAIIRRILDGQQDDDHTTLALFADAFDGPDFREGAAAFAQKRDPRF